MAGILQATGVEVTVNKTQVKSMDQAVSLGLLSAPIVRINGNRNRLELSETTVESVSPCVKAGWPF